MAGKFSLVILLFICSIFGFVVRAESSKNEPISRFARNLEKFMKQFDSFQVEGVPSRELNFDSLKHKMVNFGESTKQTLLSLKDDIKNGFKRVVNALKDIRESNKQEKIQEWNEFQTFVKQSVEKAELGVSETVSELKDFLKNIETPVEATQLVSRFIEELQTVENHFKEETINLKAKFESLFKRIEKHGGVHHRPHDKLISCGGKTYTLQEFLDEFDSEHNLLIIEEDAWSDQDLEEFYEGWEVWAKRMGLKCENGASDWKEIAVPHQDSPKDEL